MIVFAITTSTDHGGLALFEKASTDIPGKFLGKFIGEKLWTRESQPSENCTFELAQLLESKNLKIKDISDVLLDIGPGSFTGCRISASMAKTLGQSLSIPIHTITSLQLIYAQMKNSGDKSPLALLDAHKSLFYYWNEEIQKVELLTLPEVQNKSVTLEIPFSEKVLKNFPRPRTMGQLFFDVPWAFKTLIWTEVEPLYVRVPDAVEKLRKN